MLINYDLCALNPQHALLYRPHSFSSPLSSSGVQYGDVNMRIN